MAIQPNLNDLHHNILLNHPPNPWQLTGPSLGHLVLYTQDLSKIRVRMAVISRTRTAIGSSPSSTIRINHPDCAPLHLRLSVSRAPHYLASIQIHGKQGVILKDRHLFPPDPLDSPTEHPWIPLSDGDIFYVSQWPFKWEQRYNICDIDWSRYNSDLISDPETRKLVTHCSRLLANNQINVDKTTSVETPPNEQHMGILEHESDQLCLLSQSSRPDSLSSDSDSEQDEPALNNQTPLPAPQSVPNTPRSGLITPEKRLSLVITPQKSNGPLPCHSPPSGSHSQTRPPSPASVSHSQPSPPTSDPLMPNVSFRRRSYRRSPELSHQKRARVSGPATDHLSGEEGELAEDEEEENDHPSTTPSSARRQPRSVPSTQATSPSAHLRSSSNPTSTAALDPPQSPNPAPQPDLRPRRKSLLQKILIKRAVQVHLAQTSEIPEPQSGGCSGFSSTDEEDEEEELGSTDEEVATESEEHLSGVDKIGGGAGTTPPSAGPGEEMSVDDNRMPAMFQSTSRVLALQEIPETSYTQTNRIFAPWTSKTTSAEQMPEEPSSMSTSTALLSPTHLHPSQPRRSISPNIKLLETYRIEQSSGDTNTTTPPPSVVDFPLKSSFRRDSYTPEELRNFATPPGSGRAHPTGFSPAHPTSVRTVLKYNTQLNSISPSYTDTDEEQQRIERRRSLRSSTTGPLTQPLMTPSPPKNSVAAIPTIFADAGASTSIGPRSVIPHRLIRTPRSFLIKRGGSLTPLNPEGCAAILPKVATVVEEEESQGDSGIEEGGKRKVRFERDVFCLEFEQLPEELPMMNKKIKLENDSQSAGNSTPRGNRRRKSGDQGNRNRPRRSLGPAVGSVVTHQYPTRRSRSEEPSSPPDVMTLSPALHSRVSSDMSGVDYYDDPMPHFIPAGAAFNAVPNPRSSLTSSSSTTSNALSTLAPSFPSQPNPNDSILSQIKQRLLNLGLGGGGASAVVRQRSHSLPPDVSRMASLSRQEEVGTDALASDMRWLSLSEIASHPYLQNQPARSYSAPTSSSGAATRSQFPQVVSFAPQLVGVRQMLLKPIQRLSMPQIDVSSWKSVFGVWGDSGTAESTAQEKSEEASGSETDASIVLVVETEEEDATEQEISSSQVTCAGEDSRRSGTQPESQTLEDSLTTGSRADELDHEMQQESVAPKRAARRKPGPRIVGTEDVHVASVRTLRPRLNASRGAADAPVAAATTRRPPARARGTAATRNRASEVATVEEGRGERTGPWGHPPLLPRRGAKQSDTGTNGGSMMLVAKGNGNGEAKKTRTRTRTRTDESAPPFQSENANGELGGGCRGLDAKDSESAVTAVDTVTAIRRRNTSQSRK